VQARFKFFTTSGTELFSNDCVLNPAAKAKARSKEKKREKRAAAVANVAAVASADNLRLQGLLAQAQVELRQARTALSAREGELVTVKALLEHERLLHEQSSRQLRTRYDAACLQNSIAQEALSKRVKFDRSHDEELRKSNEDILRSVQSEHEQHVRTVKRRYDADLNSLQLEKDTVIESLRQQLATTEHTLLRVRTERDEFKASYLRYKTSARQGEEQTEVGQPKRRASPTPTRRAAVYKLDGPASPSDFF